MACSGAQFAVDGVSRDGVYKITAIWEYDKRPVNGANFVWFGMRLRSSASDPMVSTLRMAYCCGSCLIYMCGVCHEVQCNRDG